MTTDNTDIICNALKNHKMISFYYHGELRVVEPYTIGEYKSKNPKIYEICKLCAYQTEGGSVSNKEEGWKLFNVNEISDVQILDAKVQITRIDYKKGDMRYFVIYCEM